MTIWRKEQMHSYWILMLLWLTGQERKEIQMFANNVITEKQFLFFTNLLVQFHAEADGASEQHYTVFLITFDAERSAKLFRIENIPSGQKTWNHWLWIKIICKRLTASFALSCAIDFKQTMLAFTTTWIRSVWLTFLKHASVVSKFLSCLYCIFFSSQCIVIL